METGFDQRAWLAWLVKIRIITITLLLGIELAITRLTPTPVPERLFISVILLWYALAVFYVLLLSFWIQYRVQSSLQVVTDLILATGIVYVSGGIDSSFNFLYPLIVIVASILLPRVWAYLSAALGFILYGAVVELAYFNVIHSYSSSHPGWKSLQAIILINLFGYLTVAYLAGRLVNKLRQVDVQLQDTSGALENLQALQENIIQSISGGLITTALDGRVTLVNLAGQKLLQRAQGDLLGKAVTGFFLDPLPHVTAASVQGEVRAVSTGGETRTFRVTVSALDVPERGVVGYVYAFDDLTEIRRLEREVRMKDRLAAVGRLAAAIAHEIRNPLSSIAGSVKVLSGISALNEEQRTLVDIVTRESERLNAIISDFLAYSRDKQYRFENVDLVQLLEDTLTLLENRPASPARIQIVRDFEVQQAPSVGDGDKIKQVFWNICQNAERAMKGGGTLTVSLRASGPEWRISFADSGPGLAPQQVEKVFEPFQAQFEGGTGLGLAIVYQIVQAHQGKILVRSTPGEGTVFTLELQRAGSASQSARAFSAGAGRSLGAAAAAPPRPGKVAHG